MALCSDLEFEDEQADTTQSTLEVLQFRGAHLPISAASNDENTPPRCSSSDVPALPAMPAGSVNGPRAQGTPLRPVQAAVAQQQLPTPSVQGHISSASSIGQDDSMASFLTSVDEATMAPSDAQYAIQACNRLGVPDEERLFIVDAAQLPVKQLLITVLCKVTANQHDSIDKEIDTYLKGKKYKQHIKGRIEAMLLSGNIAAYKKDMTQRCMHHIRDKPDLYRIPQALINAGILKTPAFQSTLSTTLTYLRAEIKRKLLTLWQNNTNIYHVVQKIGKASMVPTAPMWGRWAWVQLKLIDYQEMVHKNGAKDDLFWDWIDTQLNQRREKYQHVSNPQDRAVSISRIFELMLQKHVTMFPAQAPEAQTMSPWQKDILRSLDELERYSGIDLVDAVHPDIINQESTMQSLDNAIQLEEQEAETEP